MASFETIPTIHAASNQGLDSTATKTILTVSLDAQRDSTGTINLSWQVFGAAACTAVADPQNSEWSGPKSASLAAATFRQSVGAVNQKTTFYLTCNDSAGHTAKASTDISAVGPSNPSTAFSPPPFTPSVPVIKASPSPSLASSSLPHPVASVLADTSLGAAAVSLVSLGAFGVSTTAGGIGFGSFFINILTMLAVIGNALLEAVGLRRRRYPWGTVFKVDNDQPLELAIVRLKTSEGRLVETRVTDQTGRVGFLPLPGKYELDVVKTNFVPASARLASGSIYQPVLDGSSLKIPNASTAIQINIPMESVKKHQISWNRQILQAVHLPLLILTIGLASGSAYLDQNFLNFVLVSVPLLLLLGEWLVIYPRNFGVVSDKQNKPVAGIAIQLVESNNLKVVATQTTDLFGCYSFLVRPGEYHLRIANQKKLILPQWLSEKQFTIVSQIGGLIAPSFKLESEK